MSVLMRGVVSFALVVALFLAADPATHAQDVPQGFTVTRDVAEARLWFLARDQAGKPVSGLSAAQVAVFDEGAPVKRDVRLGVEADASVRIHFVIDVSGSNQRALATVQRALGQFVAAHSRPGDVVTATAFSGNAVSARLGSAQDVAAFWSKAATLIGKPVTAIYDNFYAALADAADYDAILLISDGADNWSVHHDLADVLAASQQAPPRVFTLDIGFGRSSAPHDVLARIAEAGGGRMVGVRSVAEADRALSGIAQSLRTYYTISFPIDEGQRDGRFHAVSLRITDARVARVQMKPGYFAPTRKVSLLAGAK